MQKLKELRKQKLRKNNLMSGWMKKNKGYEVDMGGWAGADLSANFNGWYTPLGTGGVASCIAVSIRCNLGTVLAHFSQPGNKNGVEELEEWVFERMKEIIRFCVTEFGSVHGIQISANRNHLHKGGMAVNFYSAMCHVCNQFGAFHADEQLNYDGFARGVVQSKALETDVYVDEWGEMKLFEGSLEFNFAKWVKKEDGNCGPSAKSSGF